jgi:hypothetical protein
MVGYAKLIFSTNLLTFPSPTSQKNLLLTFTLTVGSITASSIISGTIYQTTRYHISEDGILYGHRNEKVKSRTMICKQVYDSDSFVHWIQRSGDTFYLLPVQTNEYSTHID